MNKNKKMKKGFTLIELVIVLAVLAIIALIAIPNFTKVRNDSLRKSDIESCNQIEKITLMAIANEDVTCTNAGGGITIEVATGGAVSVKATGGVTLKKEGEGDKSKVIYENYLKDINAPQYDNASSYIVTIEANTGNVSVATNKIDKDGN